MKALGFIETRGFVAAVEAADSALKAANVSLLGQKRAGAGLVTVILTGDVAAVKSAVEAGAGSAAAVGEVFSAQVIARPHEGMSEIIEEEPAKAEPAGRKRGGGKSASSGSDGKNEEKPGV